MIISKILEYYHIKKVIRNHRKEWGEIENVISIEPAGMQYDYPYMFIGTKGELSDDTKKQIRETAIGIKVIFRYTYLSELKFTEKNQPSTMERRNE